MNLRDLKYLTALRQYCHFGKAADACFVSQPTLSMQIKKLEAELELLLLERSGKNVRLTTAGEQIAAIAQQVLQGVDEIKKIALQARDPLAGDIHLGLIPTLAPYLLPHMIGALKKHFPKVKIILIEEKTPVLLEQLQHGKIDAALLALPVKEKMLRSIALFKEAFLLAVPHSHPLAKQKTVHVEDIARETLLLLEEGHCLRDQALTFCQRVEHGAPANFSATSLETLRYMVALGEGITFMPQLACRKHAAIRYLPFAATKPVRQIGLVFRRGCAREKLLGAIAEVLGGMGRALVGS